MSDLMLGALVRSPAPQGNAAARSDPADTSRFAGVLDTLGAPTDGTTRQRTTARSSHAPGGDEPEDDTGAEAATAGGGTGSAPVADIALLAQALLAQSAPNTTNPRSPVATPDGAAAPSSPQPSAASAALQAGASPKLTSGLPPSGASEAPPSSIDTRALGSARDAPVPVATAALPNCGPDGQGATVTQAAAQPMRPSTQTGATVPKTTDAPAFDGTRAAPALAGAPKPAAPSTSQSAVDGAMPVQTNVSDASGGAAGSVSNDTPSGADRGLDRSVTGRADEASAGATQVEPAAATPGRQTPGQDRDGAGAVRGEPAFAPPRATVADAGGNGADAPASVTTSSRPRADTQAADRPGVRTRAATPLAATRHAAAVVPVADPTTTALPPAQQVASAVQSLLETAGRPAAAMPTGLAAAGRATTPSATTVASSPGVKSMTIDLDPGHLGPVSITMRLKGEALSIEIAVDNPETLRLLDRDRHVLSAAMAATGVASDTLSVSTTATGFGDGATAGGFGQPKSGDTSGRQAAFSPETAADGRHARNQAGSHAPADTESDHDAPIPKSMPEPRGRDGSLYL